MDSQDAKEGDGDGRLSQARPASFFAGKPSFGFFPFLGPTKPKRSEAPAGSLPPAAVKGVPTASVSKAGRGQTQLQHTPQARIEVLPLIQSTMAFIRPYKPSDFEAMARISLPSASRIVRSSRAPLQRHPRVRAVD